MLLRPSRPALLFLAALGAPCVLVIGLTLRLLAQERELAEKRLADDRRRQATDVRQDLIGLLARRRADLLEGKSTVNGGDAWPVAFLARVDGDALLFPWDEGSAAGSDPPAFITAIASGERAEFAQRSYADAATSYAAALADAATPAQSATAQLHLARVLEKNGKTDRAHSAYVTLAETLPRPSMIREFRWRCTPFGGWLSRKIFALTRCSRSSSSTMAVATRIRRLTLKSVRCGSPRSTSARSSPFSHPSPVQSARAKGASFHERNERDGLEILRCV